MGFFSRRRLLAASLVSVVFGSAAACSSKEHPPLIPPPSVFNPDWPDGGVAQQDLLVEPKNGVIFVDTATTPPTVPQQQIGRAHV
jgi:hypothetical protein